MREYNAFRLIHIISPGRGIFYNDDKTFLVWVNEEDHLRIISMQKGGDLATAYARLVRAVTKIGEKFAFSRHQRIGFLTFCPTNLGTTVRASVHICIPKLSADRKKLENVANMYNLQVMIKTLKNPSLTYLVVICQLILQQVAQLFHNQYVWAFFKYVQVELHNNFRTVTNVLCECFRSTV